MKFFPTILAAAVGAVVAVGAMQVLHTPQQEGQAAPVTTMETRWESVKRTGVLRCGYYIWPPVLTFDANTKQVGGVFYDIMQEVGKQLNLKVEWTMEVTHAHMLTDLNQGRFDMICSPVFATPGRTREAVFTHPMMSHPAYFYARKDDTRFDNNVAAANAKDVKIVSQDGGFSQIIAQEDFPQASTDDLPQVSSSADMFNEVVARKGDLTVAEPFTFAGYNKANPDKLRQVAGPPLRITPVAFTLPAGALDFKAALDTTLDFLQGSGFLDKVYRKYETGTARILRPPLPYQQN